MQDIIDLDRCVWDEQYRSLIKQTLNYPRRPAGTTANENTCGRPSATDRRVPAPPE